MQLDLRVPLSLQDIRQSFDCYASEAVWHKHPRGEGWVDNLAKVDDSCTVCDRAFVGGNAQISHGCVINGRSAVRGAAVIRNGVRISNDVDVFGHAEIDGHVSIQGGVLVFDNAKIKGYVSISGTIHIMGNAKVVGGTYPDNELVIRRFGRFDGGMIVTINNNHLVLGPFGGRNDVLTVVRNPSGTVWVTTGCFCGKKPGFVTAVRKTHSKSVLGMEYLSALEYAVDVLERRAMRHNKSAK